MLFDRCRIRIEEMLIVLGEHVDSFCRHKSAVRNTSQELLRHAATVDTSLRSVELIDEGNLNRLLESLAQRIELLVSIFKLIVATDPGGMLIARTTTEHHPRSPSLRIGSVSPFCHVEMYKLTEDLDSSRKRYKERHVLQDL